MHYSAAIATTGVGERRLAAGGAGEHREDEKEAKEEADAEVGPLGEKDLVDLEIED